MKINVSFGVFLVLSIGLVSALDDTTTAFPTPSTRPALVPVTSKDELPVIPTTTSTDKPTTTEPPTTTTVPTTTSPSTTTTDKPTTTTEKPTTTEAPTTTTVPPTTTTTVAPPTPAPTPVPAPTTYTWVWTEKNVTCLIVQFAAQLNFTYPTIDNKTENVLYNIPSKNFTYTGDCGNGTTPQQFVVLWNDSSLLLRFEQNTTDSRFGLSEIVLGINPSNDFPNAKNETFRLYHVGNVFNTPLHHSYYCTKVQTLNLTANETSTIPIASLRLSHVQLEAYHTTEGTHFSQANDCDAIDTPDIVPIAVGIALTALVAVVLIAYLVGRRRAQARGYVSM